MKKNTFIMLLAAVVVLGGAIGGALIGGMSIGKGQGREEANQELQSQLSQFTSRFGQRGTQQGTPQPGSELPGGFGSQRPGGFGGLFGSGGTVGTVEKIEGNILTLTTPQGSVRVIIADDTPIQKMGEGSLSDISIGERITVSGEQKDDGSIEATNVFLAP